MPGQRRPAPRTKSPEARRDELMRAALRLFLERGIPATTVEQITAGADVAKGTFYLHFRSKDEVLAALRERYLQEFVARIDDRLAACAPHDWKGKLRTWADSAVAATMDTLDVHDVVFRDAPAALPREPPDSARVVQQHLAGLLQQGHLAGAWRVEDAAFTAAFLFNGLHAALEGALKDGQDFDHTAFVEKAEQIFHRAVALLPD